MGADAKIAVQRFITATRSLFASQPNLELRWQQLKPALAELLADSAVIDNSRKWPDCVPTDRAENLLFYEDPDYGFVINGLVKAQYRNRAQIHDHAHIFTLYGVLDGSENIERYERLDDGSKADYAQVRQTHDLKVGPGDLDLVRPWEIHTENNGADRAVAVIIRSEKSGGFLQGRYDPVTKKYWQGYGPRQTPYKIQ